MVMATLTGQRVTEAGLPGDFATVTLSLDAPAPEALTFAFATVDGTAGSGQGDYQDVNLLRRVTIPPGGDGAEYRIRIREDELDEPQEAFSVVAFVTGGDVGFAGGAPALVAPIEILPGEVEGGIVAALAATPLAAPEAVDGAPTIRAYDVTVQEGDGDGYATLNVPIVLSGPAPREIRLEGYLQDITAGPRDTNPLRDQTTLVIAEGATGGVLSVPIRRDDLVEGDETYDMIVTGATGGARFEGGAAALAARIVIRDDDDGDAASAGPREGSPAPTRQASCRCCASTTSPRSRRPTWIPASPRPMSSSLCRNPPRRRSGSTTPPSLSARTPSRRTRRPATAAS
ncbi:hypothetical protein N9W17_05635 [Jannaschia sp.]|nr:hypothetical protein [Jannaschia sp.]